MALLCGRRGTESPKYSCLPDTELSKIMLRKRRESVSSQGKKNKQAFHLRCTAKHPISPKSPIQSWCYLLSL